jgi:hypothetical protein
MCPMSRWAGRLGALAALLTILALAGPALACPKVDHRPPPGPQPAIAYEHQPPLDRLLEAQGKALDAKVDNAISLRRAAAAKVGNKLMVSYAGPRKCADSVTGDGVRRESVCIKVWVEDYVAIYGAADMHAYQWVSGRGWLDSRFQTQTLRYEQMWHRDPPYTTPVQAFTFGQRQGTLYRCFYQSVDSAPMNCSVPNAINFSLFSTGVDIPLGDCTREFSTANVEIAYRTDRGDVHGGDGQPVIRFTIASPWFRLLI